MRILKEKEQVTTQGHIFSRLIVNLETKKLGNTIINLETPIKLKHNKDRSSDINDRSL